MIEDLNYIFKFILSNQKSKLKLNKSFYIFFRQSGISEIFICCNFEILENSKYSYYQFEKNEWLENLLKTNLKGSLNVDDFKNFFKITSHTKIEINLIQELIIFFAILHSEYNVLFFHVKNNLSEIIYKFNENLIVEENLINWNHHIIDNFQIDKEDIYTVTRKSIRNTIFLLKNQFFENSLVFIFLYKNKFILNINKNKKFQEFINSSTYEISKKLKVKFEKCQLEKTNFPKYTFKKEDSRISLVCFVKIQKKKFSLKKLLKIFIECFTFIKQQSLSLRFFSDYEQKKKTIYTKTINLICEDILEIENLLNHPSSNFNQLKDKLFYRLVTS